jgi:hypothetical protein
LNLRSHVKQPGAAWSAWSFAVAWTADRAPSDGQDWAVAELSHQGQPGDSQGSQQVGARVLSNQIPLHQDQPVELGGPQRCAVRGMV